MTVLGRNDPCSCGSGKKYKKCCLAKEAPPPQEFLNAPQGSPGGSQPPLPFPVPPQASSGWAFTLRERDSAIAKLMRFVRREEFSEDCRVAFALFAGEGLLEPPSQTTQEAMDSDMAQINFHSWLLYDMDLEEGQTLAHRFLQRRGHDLSYGERAYVEKALEARFGLYEIMEVRLDDGFTLKDLFSGETLRVHEKMATHGLVQWDVAAMRLMDYGGGYRCIDAGIIPFRRDDKEALLKELAKLKKRIAAPSDAHFFKRAVPALNRWWLDRTVNPPLPTVVTAEGDPVVITKVRFDILDASVLRSALDAGEAFDREEESAWGWGEPHPDGGRRDLGRVEIEGGSLILAVTSKQRGKRGRKLLEALAGSAIRHRATEHKDWKQAVAERKAEGEPADDDESEIPPEEERRILREYLDTHYHKWPDTPLPALGGKTPRQAARDKRSRPKVVDLLKYLEHSQASGRLHHGPPYDFAWLWKDLGLDRDKETRG